MCFNGGKGSASLRGVKETIDHKLAGRTQIDPIDNRFFFFFFIDKTCTPLCAHRLLPLTQAITRIEHSLILLGDKIATDLLCRQ